MGCFLGLFGLGRLSRIRGLAFARLRSALRQAQIASQRTAPVRPMDFLKLWLNPMNRRRRIYEGKAKVLYEGPEPGTLIQKA